MNNEKLLDKTYETLMCESPQTLLSPKALELSLSAPRAPPFGSAQRDVLMGRIPTMEQPASDNMQYHVRKQTTQHWDFHLRRMILQRWKNNKNSSSRCKRGGYTYHRRHPQLAPTSSDSTTRRLGQFIALNDQNYFRDAGWFQWLADQLVVATIPFMALSAPLPTVPSFIRLTRSCQSISYGLHPMQCIHLYLPPINDSTPTTRLLFFVHGGAWGSGSPWMYRLIAKPFLDEGWAVAIVGYRTYPDSPTVQDQLDDLECAAATLQQHRTFTHVSIMGHSSGAHIALLMLVKRIEAQLLQTTTWLNSWTTSTTERRRSTVPSEPHQRMQFVSFIGVSGPYDISHHFDYEAARGVEEVSPMKPVNGYTRHNMRMNSPVRALRHLLRLAVAAGSSEFHAMNDLLPPRMVLLHGMDDDTVPFTATAEAAQGLRSCGVTQIQEIYLPETGHQDAVVQIMLGGRVRDAIMNWINNSSNDKLSDYPERNILSRSRL